jgi:alpha,alpha-trehalase
MAADASSGGMTGMLHPSLRPLLRAVQDARVYPDSKAAVDLVLRRDPGELARLAAEALPGLVEGVAAPSSVSREALAAFLEQHCDPPGSDLEPHTPEDWRPDPPQLRRLGPRPEVGAPAMAASPLPPLLTDAERAAVHELARTAVHGRWRVLCRRWKGADGVGGGDGEDAAAARRRRLTQRSSLLPLPEPQMVPGDRFREAYYWDSYWVIRGLLASGMLDTAAGTVRNLVAMADATAAASGGGADGGASSSSLPGGHVPNGARCYYLNRSQPPLLAPMARAVAEAVLTSGGEEGDGDPAAADALLRRCFPAIERELAHWRCYPKQVVCVAANVPKEEHQEGATPVHALARYWAQWEGPRPESQREDEATAAEALAEAAATGNAGINHSDRMHRRLMRDLASAAESGWDFSTRWMPPPPASAGGMRAWEEARTTTTTTMTDGDGSNSTASPPTRPSLAQLRTTRVVPADLNAFLYRAERDAAWAARRLGEQERAARLEALARQREKAMRAVLWDERAACWRDGWMVRRRRRAGGEEEGDRGAAVAAGGGSFPLLEGEEEDGDDQKQQQPWIVHRSPGVYASNYIPMWCGLLDDDEDDDDREEDEAAAPASSAATADRAALSLLASGLLQPGGVAASLYASGQQWDWPNAWPPLQHALAEACCATQGEQRRRSPQARRVGLGVAAAYARAVLQGWGHGGEGGGGELHEKYDARGGGREGGGGEYAPQVGFGWTNGALLALLAAGLV